MAKARKDNLDVLAAIDLGSNSFHMVIARVDANRLQPIDRIGEKVQLAKDMSAGMISSEAMERGWACMRRFKERLDDLKPDVIRIVGTNALRAARNGQTFIDRAEDILGVPVEIIAGREEARLVYLGVAHTLGDNSENRLVIDIGGGSTELIIGCHFEATMMESLHMGCVSYMQRFFPKACLSEENFDRAYQAACLELLNIQSRYQQKSWQNCVGSSGTLQAVEQVLINYGWSEGGISRAGLLKLKKALFTFKHLDEVSFNGLKENRRSVFASGLAIVLALFDTLEIDEMSISNGALREGVLYDLLGRLGHEDVRERTVLGLEKRYDVDTAGGEKLAHLALSLWSQVRKEWAELPDSDRLLSWAARLSEVGMAISHSQFHKHGAYILGQSDLPGFSRQQQQVLAALVRGHRRKFPLSTFSVFGQRRAALERMCLVLRLAVVLKHALVDVSQLKVSLDKNGIDLCFPEGWLDDRPLTQAELRAEFDYLSQAGYSLGLH
jgi:exopolyphosphatase/guanosine-5'-triphosphate,3'-diphosphate pyrophosphatase